MVSLIFAQLLSILVTGGLRFGAEAVVPGGGVSLWIGLMTGAALGLVLALRREIHEGQQPWKDRGRVLLWLAFPGAAALNWRFGQTTLLGGYDAPALAMILGAVVATLVSRRAEWGDRWTNPGAWATGARWLLAPTLLGFGIAMMRIYPTRGLWFALGTYPVYAFAQLAAALVLPWTQWARDGIRPAWRVAGVTVLFAFVHWPNPFAAAVTAAGMLLWALAWRAGSALVPIALSMGLLATAVTEALPESVTAHMRVGANYVLKSRESERNAWLDAEADRIAHLAAWSDEEGLRPWLGRALAEIEGGPVDEGVVEGTAEALERLQRESIVRAFYDSGEFRRRNRIRQGLHPDELSFFESTFVPHLPAHRDYYRLVHDGRGQTNPEFVKGCYEELLEREPRPVEYRHWARSLGPARRWEFLRRVLAGGGIDAWRQPAAEDARERLRESRAATPR